MNKHGTDGQFLEMHKRCTDYKCTATSGDAGFVPFGSEDWTNSVANTQKNTEFTIFAVVKTYQQPGDVNPMGIISLLKGNDALKGLGVYKIPSICKPLLKSTVPATLKLGLCAAKGDGCEHIHLLTDGYGKRSTKAGAYNGMYVHFKEATANVDLNTKHPFTELVCKIKQYLIVGYVHADITTDSADIVLTGGAGKVSGIDLATLGDRIGSAYPTVRFGSPGAAGTGQQADTIITAIAADGANTKITFAAAKTWGTSATPLRKGTPIYFATHTATNFYTTVVEDCTGTKLDDTGADNPRYMTSIPANTEVEISTGDGVNCKGNPVAGLAPFGRLSTLSGFYGGEDDDKIRDDKGDAGCETECGQFGCDPSTGNFGNPTWEVAGVLKDALTANTDDVKLVGQVGPIPGWVPSNALTPTAADYPKIRFGSIDDAHASGDHDLKDSTAITINADGDTVLKLGTAYDFSAAGKNVPAGTKVYFALAQDTDFRNHVKNSCVKKFGSARKLQDPDTDFHIVTIRASVSATTDKLDAKIYIDGLHDGCERADTCTITAPAEFTAVAPQALQSLRIGMMTTAPAAGTSSTAGGARLAGALKSAFANVDIAEMLVYSKALSVEEMDRVGNYLSVKFNLPKFRLNSFIRSTTRSVAVSARAGCDHILNEPHMSSICDGYPGCSTVDEDTLVLSREMADADTTDYYKGMRLYITGGGTKTDKTILSAKGQSCHIEGYTAASRTVDCDLTGAGQAGYILWGGATFPCFDAAKQGCTAATNAVAVTDTLLTVTWVPLYWKTPYYAALGADTGNREIVKVLSVAIAGNKYQLTVIRKFAGATPAAITWANAKELHANAKIVYARSALMRDIANAATKIVMAGFIKSCDVDTDDTRCAIASDILPLGAASALTNLQIKVTRKTPAVTSLAVSKLETLEYSLKQSEVAGAGYASGMAIDPAIDTVDRNTAPALAFNAGVPEGLAANDLILLGTIADGEVILVKSITDADTIVVARGIPLPVAMTGRKTFTLDAAMTNSQTTMDITTALTLGTGDGQIEANSLLLMGTIDNSDATEIVKVTAVAADTPSAGKTRLTVVRGQGYKASDGSARGGNAVQSAGTTITLLTKSHADGTTMTLIGKDGEPLVRTTNAAAGSNNEATAEGVLIDFAIKPQGGRAVTGGNYDGGSGISTYKIEPCDPYLPPYFADGPIQVVQGQEYLKSPGSGYGGSFTADTRTTGNAFWVNADGVTSSSETGPVSAAASGGTVLELKGWYLAPMDLNIEGATNDAETRGSTVERNENYLLVTVGARPSECADPTQTTPCADGKYENREAALTCNLVEVPGGFCEEDWSIPCKCLHNTVCANPCAATKKCLAGPAYGVKTQTTWYPTSKPSMRCELPGTLNANQDLNLYWHGVKTTFSNWYRPHAPVVTKLEPSSAIYSGGATVTITGSNFGPKDVWTAVNKAGTKTTTTRTATVSFVGKGMAKYCDSLVYVSDKELVCKVPALANQKQDMDKSARTVKVSVVIDAGGMRSRSDSSGVLQYSSVPTYFTCNSNEVSETGKNECFSCCRSACIVDEFAQGAQKGGATYSHCDTSCYKYCGFTSK
jgi:hypothetical protein